ncbi:hypothetical protein G6F23_014590 [Rhizopus arrhizus]|nr:hypothetical protein G6F23_014590 [Rhizopus arrhizus]
MSYAGVVLLFWLVGAARRAAAPRPGDLHLCRTRGAGARIRRLLREARADHRHRAGVDVRRRRDAAGDRAPGRRRQPGRAAGCAVAAAIVRAPQRAAAWAPEQPAGA